MFKTMFPTFKKLKYTSLGLDTNRSPEGNPVKETVQDPAPWAVNNDTPSMGVLDPTKDER